MTEVQRPRFCKELDDNIGKLIFSHLRLFLARRICRAVCKAWRHLIAQVSPLNYGMFVDYIREYDDAHMGVLALWAPRFDKIILPIHQLHIIDTCLYHDKPSALVQMLAQSTVLPTRTSIEMLDQVLEGSARYVFASFLMPMFGAIGERGACFVRVFSLGHPDFFKWYLQSFPMPAVDAGNIQFASYSSGIDEKIKAMSTMAWNREWWTQWFMQAAGIRTRYRDAKYKLHFREEHADARYRYNADVAVAIVEHVLHAVPWEALEYLSNAKVRLNRQRDDALLKRLEPWCGKSVKTIPVMQSLVSRPSAEKKRRLEFTLWPDAVLGAPLPSEDDSL